MSEEKKLYVNPKRRIFEDPSLLSSIFIIIIGLPVFLLMLSPILIIIFGTILGWLGY